MLRMLRGARAHPDYVKAAKLYSCEACEQTKSKPRTHPVAPPPRDHSFNVEVQVDIFEIHDCGGTRYSILSIVDVGTRYHQAEIVRHDGGQPTSMKCLQAFLNSWVKWAGLPTTVTTDRGLHNRGIFARYLAAHSVILRTAQLNRPNN